MVGVMMRGTDETSGSLFSYVDLDEHIPARHPLRKIRQVVNDACERFAVLCQALIGSFRQCHSGRSLLREAVGLLQDRRLPCQPQSAAQADIAIFGYLASTAKHAGWTVARSMPQNFRNWR
jgi:hypothetical protein